MNELKSGNTRLGNLIDALKYNAIKTEKMWVLIDGEPSELQIEIVRSQLPQLCGLIRDEIIYDIFQLCDRNKADSDINVPFNLVHSTFAPVKNWPYNTDIEATSVPICLATCRPFTNIIHRGREVNWNVKAEEIYGKNYLSINNRFGECIEKYEKYPTKEEFLVYVYKYYSSRNYKTLPVCISQFVDEIFEDYSFILNSVEPSIFMERWFYSKHNSVRLRMERS